MQRRRAGEDRPLLNGNGGEDGSGAVAKEATVKIPVTWALLIVLVLTIGYFVFLFIEYPLDFFFFVEVDTQFYFSILVHVGVFIVVMPLEAYAAYRLRRARDAGHHGFHRRNAWLSSVPDLVLSAGNAAIVALCALWAVGVTYADFTRLDALKVIAGIELLLIVPTTFVLTMRVARFNWTSPPPDAANELLNAEDFPDGTPRAASEVIEHQVDVIKSLQQQKDTLSQRILDLNERVRTLESTVTIQ